MIPPFIYCPKCGRIIKLSEDGSAPVAEMLAKASYKALGRGQCPCGVTAVLCFRELPNSPTFTLMFDLYQVKEVALA